MPFNLNQKFKTIDQSGRQTPDQHTWKDHSLDLWEPLIIRKPEIDAEVDRLASKARPNNGIRRTQQVHPRAEEGTLSDVLDSEAYGMLRTRETADHAEAARAFVEKRAPVFKGA